MNKSFKLFFVLSFAVMLQACGTKSETSNNTMDSVSDAAVDAKAQEADRVAKRDMMEKARTEKAEMRMTAMIEKSKVSPSYTDASGTVVYNKAETDPAFKGGKEAMTSYLRDNLIYPSKASENGIEGTVFVNFIVDSKGNVREVVASDVIGDDVDATLTDEAVRVVKAMPAWIAGRQHGKDVDVNFSIPITFALAD